MNNSKQVNGITRSEFVGSSGLIAAGMAFLPGISFSCKGETQPALAEYTLVIPDSADPIEKEAAERLQQYLSELLATPVSLEEEDAYHGKKAIYIGNTQYAADQQIDFGSLAADGYIYKPVGENIILAGGDKKGVLYGVYDLLEALGFRKYSPAYTHIPQADNITLPADEKLMTPMVNYRTTSYSEMDEEGLADWHKLSSRDDWGLFVHTFNELLPPDEYGKSHPEYFSLIGKERIPATQLCLSNPEVLAIVTANLKKKIAEKPDATYWSVSQNDNDQYCQCSACTALNEKYGNVPSGSMLYFVNQVAREFPDKIISTLAYWYTRAAPKNIKAEPNVNIMLCNIESKRQGPVYETDPDFSNDLVNWGNLADDILLWDYNIQFTNFYSPFPNLYTIKPNIKFYTDHNVKAFFMQSNSEPTAEMALLRAYLIYKLMWDPKADDQAIIDDFLEGYYGAASPYLREYILLLDKSMKKSGIELDIFGSPIQAKDGYLSADMMEQYKKLFDQAEAAVQSDAELLRRVEVARLPILYAEIQIGRTEIDTPRSMYQHKEDGTIEGKAEMKAQVDRFVEVCNREGVQLVRERAGSPDHFKSAYDRIYSKMEEISELKSFGKKISPITTPGEQSKGVEALTDGMYASYEAWQDADPNWMYYDGKHMDFVLDLGEVMPVSEINMDFLNPQAQPDWHLTALPKYVSYAISTDGKSFEAPITVENPHNPNPFENPDISKVSVQSFKADLNAGSQARYIKVHAENLLKMPSWHIRSGQPCRIYTDEIVVK